MPAADYIEVPASLPAAQSRNPAASRDAVHKFHEAGLANEGTDEGEPGPRSFAPNAYAAYLQDPDGNKITAICFAPE